MLNPFILHKNDRSIIFIYIILILLFTVFSLSGCLLLKKDFVKKKEENQEKKLLEAAKTLFERGKYKNVRDICSLFILSYPLSSLKEDVQYLLAQSFFMEGSYKKAEYEYEMFLRNYPDTSREEEILKKISFCREISKGEFKIEETRITEYPKEIGREEKIKEEDILEPIETPTIIPKRTQTIEPTSTQTIEPTRTPTIEPTRTPTIEPTPTRTPTIE
ncbi:outer membrane protein assembly factor BamD, partial [bacterium]|nr:outer membrane protein assembly factor BamD [bacterium]